MFYKTTTCYTYIVLKTVTIIMLFECFKTCISFVICSVIVFLSHFLQERKAFAARSVRNKRSVTFLFQLKPILVTN